MDVFTGIDRETEESAMRQALMLGITAIATVVASNVHADDVHADIGGMTAVALVVASNVRATDVQANIEDELSSQLGSIQLGKGMQFSDEGAVFPISQSRDPSRDIEYHFSTWVEGSDNTEIRLGNPLSSKLGLSWTPGVAPGVAMAATQTELPGTRGQAYNHFRFRDHGDRRLKLDVGRLHYSNGKRISDHSYGSNLDANDAKFGPTWVKTF